MADASGKTGVSTTAYSDARFGPDDSLSVSGDHRPNDVRVRVEAGLGAFRLSISGPVRSRGSCQSLRAQRWRCPHSVNASTHIDVQGRSGRDRVRIRDGVPGGASLSGGRGRDKLAGADSADVLFGGVGNDVLRGGPGDDHLGTVVNHKPEAGADSYYGGAGDDVVRAGDAAPDKVIRCGAGDDTLFKDGVSDPRAHGCEHVTRGQF